MTFNYSIRKATTNNDKIIRSNWVRYSFCRLNVFVSFSPFIHQDLYVKKILQPGETTISTIDLKVPIHRPPVAHEPRRHQLWLDRPPRMSSSSLLPTVKQRKIHTWKFGDKHIEMAETGALGVFFEGLLLKSMQKTPWAGSAGEFCHRSCGCCMAWCFLFTLSQGSRVFVAAWGWKTPSHTLQLKTGGKFTAWNRFTSKATDSLFPATKSHLVQKNTLPNRLCLHSPVKQTTLALKINQPQVISTNLNGVSAMLHQLGNVTICQCNCEASCHGRNDLTRWGRICPGRAWIEPSVFRILSGRTGRMRIEMKNTFLQMTGVSFSCAGGKKSQLPLALDCMSMCAIWNRCIPGLQLTLTLNKELLDG